MEIKGEPVELKLNMEALMSLVGKDEETIVEALKALAGNGIKVKDQEEEIKSLCNDLEKLKEENHYLKNKMDYKRDIIDDLENILDKKDDEIKQIKKDFETKDKEFNDLGNINLERVEEINILRENNLSMVKQIGENLKMEKIIEIQNNLIRELKEELNAKELNSPVDMSDDIQKLLTEAEELNQKNKEKGIVLEHMEVEKKSLFDKLEILEEKNKLLVIEIESFQSPQKAILSICEEIRESNVQTIECDLCEKIFDKENDLIDQKQNIHEAKQELRNKLTKLELKLSEQKLTLLSKIYKLKETEIELTKSCNCRGFCLINHRRYGWKKSKANDLETKFSHVTSANNII